MRQALRKRDRDRKRQQQLQQTDREKGATRTQTIRERDREGQRDNFEHENKKETGKNGKETKSGLPITSRMDTAEVTGGPHHSNACSSNQLRIHAAARRHFAPLRSPETRVNRLELCHVTNRKKHVVYNPTGQHCITEDRKRQRTGDR